MAQGSVVRYALDTTDPEEAHAWLRQSYQEHTPRLSGDTTRFRMRLESVGVDAFRVDQCLYTMNLDVDVDPLHALVLVHPREGRLAVQGSGGEVDQRSGGLILFDPLRPYRAQLWSPIDMQVVRMELGPAQQIAEGVTGLPASQVRFELSTPVSASRGRYLQGVVEHVRGLLSVEEIGTEPLVRAEMFRMLTTAVLMAFPCNAMDALADRPAPGTLTAEPQVVRRAVEFIDANAQRAVGLGDIAEAARISPRGLQFAFRRHLDSTPLEYLRRVRMEGAHRDLKAGDPTRGDSVGAVAMGWGFTHPGRFAVGYRHLYGCAPSTTLRQ